MIINDYKLCSISYSQEEITLYLPKKQTVMLDQLGFNLKVRRVVDHGNDAFRCYGGWQVNEEEGIWMGLSVSPYTLHISCKEKNNNYTEGEKKQENLWSGD